MSAALKYLVCSLGTELKKLTSGSEESITPREFSEWNTYVYNFLVDYDFIHTSNIHEYLMKKHDIK